MPVKKSRAIGHIVKYLGGKRQPKAHKHDWSRYKFPTSLLAGTAAWTILQETGRECAAFGNVLTMHT